jgi:hypothetical protein
VFWRVFGAGKRRGDTTQKVFKKLKSLKIDKKSEKYKIQHMTPGRPAE